MTMFRDRSLTTDIVECFIELLDYSHLLVVKHDLVVIHNFQYCLGRQQAQVTIFFVRVNDLEHPEDGARVDDIYLVRCVMFYVKVYHVEKLVKDPPVFRVQ